MLQYKDTRILWRRVQVLFSEKEYFTILLSSFQDLVSFPRYSSSTFLESPTLITPSTDSEAYSDFDFNVTSVNKERAVNPQVKA